MRVWVWGVAISCLFVGRGVAQERISLSDDIQIQPVEEGVWLVVHRFAGGNNSLLVQCGERDVVWCDTPCTNEATAQVLDWLRETISDVNIIQINTGFHNDNLGGNGVLQERGIPCYGSDLTPQLIEKDWPKTVQKVLPYFSRPSNLRYRDVLRTQVLTPPNRLFPLQEGLTLDVGGQAVEVYFPGPTHTLDNTVVYFPQRQLLYGGCMVKAMDARNPGFTGDADTAFWPVALERILQRYPKARLVVPGHGTWGNLDLVRHTLDLCNDYRLYLLTEEYLPFFAKGLGPTIEDRDAWAKLAQHPAWQGMVKRAEDYQGQPLPVLSDELYLEFSQNGNRVNYERPYGSIQSRLKTLVLAECLEAQGRFISDITLIIAVLCDLPSWTMPAHDGDLKSFHREQYNIDLGASSMAWTLATTDYLLAGSLPIGSRAKLREHLNLRIFDPIRAQVEGRLKKHWWFTTTNNWNAVCLANVAGAALAVLQDRRDRAFYVRMAEQYIHNFLAGFTPDGYCTEGLGYWNYGYGRFVFLAETLMQATDGKVDLLAYPAAQAPARFGWNIQLTDNLNPSFADCSVTAKADPKLLWYLGRRLGQPWVAPDYDPTTSGGKIYEALLFSCDNTARHCPTPAGKAVLPQRSWFDQAGVLIARPGESSSRLSLAIKGGHNNEHHNHNDVGSYVLAVDGQLMLTDPGSEVYTARTFSKQRYESDAMNSYGHPVPLIAGQMQHTGRDAQAQWQTKDFTDTQDHLAMDLTSAYPVPELKQVIRSVYYDRSGSGCVTIVDQAEFATAQTFETCFITFETVTQTGPNQWQVTRDNTGLVIEIDTQGNAYEVRSTPLTADFRAEQTPERWAIRLQAPVEQAGIKLTLTPSER